MTVTYPLTASEDIEDIEVVCNNINGFYIPENGEFFATIIKCGGSLETSVVLPNSGEVEAQGMVGGLHPNQTPK